MNELTCPYCGKEDFIPEVVWGHTEAYGAGIKNFACNNCGKIVQAKCYQRVVITDARKTDSISDWD